MLYDLNLDKYRVVGFDLQKIGENTEGGHPQHLFYPNRLI